MSVRLAAALVHHPVLDKSGQVFTTSITNLDVHDIARSAKTYGLDAFYVVTPVTAQQEMARAIIGYWAGGEGLARNPDRNTALELVRVVATVQDAVGAEAAAVGARPLVVATSARPPAGATLTTDELRIRLAAESALLVFGTGHGLAPAVLDASDAVLAPLWGRAADGYNHLSVRSAVAIFFDRLRG